MCKQFICVLNLSQVSIYYNFQSKDKQNIIISCLTLPCSYNKYCTTSD